MKIYVASSWKNIYQPTVIRLLRALDIEAYDFRDEVGKGGNAFKWDQIDPEWQAKERWRDVLPEGDVLDEAKAAAYADYKRMLAHSLARQGFAQDMGALRACDRCILVLPCGRSAHLEAGWAIGAGKPTAIYIPEYDTPDLMYLMAPSDGYGIITDSLGELVAWLGVEQPDWQELESGEIWEGS